MRTMNRLLPCPFCGGEAAYGNVPDDCMPPHPDQGGHFICCTNAACGASTNLRFAYGDDPKPLLAEQWNRRTENVEALRELDQIATTLGMEDTSDMMVDEIVQLLADRDQIWADRRKARSEGVAAFRGGIPRTLCPYMSTLLRESWFDGWDAGGHPP